MAKKSDKMPAPKGVKVKGVIKDVAKAIKPKGWSSNIVSKVINPKGKVNKK